MPEDGLDANAFAGRVWALAAPCELPVHFLCVLTDRSDAAKREAAMRLRLATLASLIRDGKVEVTTEVVTRQGWVGAVRSTWMPGDLVFWGTGGSSHVAIYLGDYQIIESGGTGHDVHIGPIWGHPVGAARVLQ